MVLLPSCICPVDSDPTPAAPVPALSVRASVRAASKAALKDALDAVFVRFKSIALFPEPATKVRAAR